MLLLSSKLLSDTDALLKIQQDGSAQEQQRRAMRMLLSGRKMPPIPYLIAGFIQKKSVSSQSKYEPDLDCQAVTCLLSNARAKLACACESL